MSEKKNTKQKQFVIITPNDDWFLYNIGTSSTAGQVLENACERLGLSANKCELRFQNKKLHSDMRLLHSAIPNHARIELKTLSRQSDDMVNVDLLIDENDTVYSGKFKLADSLWDVVSKLIPPEVVVVEGKTSVLYIGQEIVGKGQLSKTKISSLGVNSGKLIFRLCRKYSDISLQKTSKVKSSTSKERSELNEEELDYDESVNCLSALSDPYSKELAENIGPDYERFQSKIKVIRLSPLHYQISEEFKAPIDIQFLNDHHGLIYTKSSHQNDNDFAVKYIELSVEDVASYDEEREPTRRGQLDDGSSLSLRSESLQKTPDIGVNVQFPDEMVLQGKFRPTETVKDLMMFVSSCLETPNSQFYLYKNPKEILEHGQLLSRVILGENEILYYGYDPKFLKHREPIYLKPNLKGTAVTEDIARIAAKINRGSIVQSFKISNN